MKGLSYIDWPTENRTAKIRKGENLWQEETKNSSLVDSWQLTVDSCLKLLYSYTPTLLYLYSIRSLRHLAQ